MSSRILPGPPADHRRLLGVTIPPYFNQVSPSPRHEALHVGTRLAKRIFGQTRPALGTRRLTPTHKSEAKGAASTRRLDNPSRGWQPQTNTRATNDQGLLSGQRRRPSAGISAV